MKRFFGVIMAAAVIAGGSVMFAQTKTETSGYPSEKSVMKDLKKEKGTIFPLGGQNVNYEKYFTGRTFHNSMAADSISVSNVTFTKGAHTFWHVHHGSCQILVTEAGRGFYQIWGEKPVELKPGVVATIPEGVKHWHGAAPNATMQHLSVMQKNPDVSTEWLEEVDPAEYAKLGK